MDKEWRLKQKVKSPLVNLLLNWTIVVAISVQLLYISLPLWFVLVAGVMVILNIYCALYSARKILNTIDNKKGEKQ